VIVSAGSSDTSIRGAVVFDKRQPAAVNHGAYRATKPSAPLAV
jgi:hypothetical protein